MLATVAYVLLLLAPAGGGQAPLIPPPEGLVLDAGIGDENNPDIGFVSVWVDKGGKIGAVITDTMTSRLTDTGLTYALRLGDKGLLPKAETKDGKAVPQSMTAVRTTHRPVRQVTDIIAYREAKRAEDSTFTANRWGESDLGIRNDAGRGVDAKLIEGGKNGTVLVRCACEVTGDKAKGYTYTYTVENLTDKPVRFKWAGLEGEVGPKKTFTRAEPSNEFTWEESGLAEFDFGEKRQFAIRANVWARPK